MAIATAGTGAAVSGVGMFVEERRDDEGGRAERGRKGEKGEGAEEDKGAE